MNNSLRCYFASDLASMFNEPCSPSYLTPSSGYEFLVSSVRPVYECIRMGVMCTSELTMITVILFAPGYF